MSAQDLTAPVSSNTFQRPASASDLTRFPPAPPASPASGSGSDAAARAAAPDAAHAPRAPSPAPCSENEVIACESLFRCRTTSLWLATVQCCAVSRYRSIPMLTHTHLHTQTLPHTRTHLHADMNTNTHTHTHTNWHNSIHAHTHTTYLQLEFRPQRLHLPREERHLAVQGAAVPERAPLRGRGRRPRHRYARRQRALR